METLTHLKFKAWHKRNKKMLYGFIIDFHIEEIYSSLPIDGALDYSYEFDDINLMQCTGIKDKNGKEIYEGDIVQNYAMQDEVVFDKGCFVGRNGVREKFGQKQPIAVHSQLEVMGNIYEDPK